ncbi:MAG: hypothetical protein KBT36_07890 [Kurthia sp.]|nr:hypothetical protein [Candidatus Kurthia equi]
MNYELYQSLLNAMKEKDFNTLQTILSQPLKGGISPDFIRSIRTFKCD